MAQDFTGRFDSVMHIWFRYYNVSISLHLLLRRIVFAIRPLNCLKETEVAVHPTQRTAHCGSREALPPLRPSYTTLLSSPLFLQSVLPYVLVVSVCKNNDIIDVSSGIKLHMLDDDMGCRGPGENDFDQWACEKHWAGFVVRSWQAASKKVSIDPARGNERSFVRSISTLAVWIGTIPISILFAPISHYDLLESSLNENTDAPRVVTSSIGDEKRMRSIKTSNELWGRVYELVGG